jgi:hypothetical protein
MVEWKVGEQHDHMDSSALQKRNGRVVSMQLFTWRFPSLSIHAMFYRKIMSTTERHGLQDWIIRVDHHGKSYVEILIRAMRAIQNLRFDRAHMVLKEFATLWNHSTISVGELNMRLRKNWGYVVAYQAPLLLAHSSEIRA